MEEFSSQEQIDKQALKNLKPLENGFNFTDYIQIARDLLRGKYLDFRVEPQRANRYYRFQREFNFYPNYLIPLGKNDFIAYQGFEYGGTNDRDLETYKNFIFPSDKDDEKFKEFFAQGKTVVELGSGRAIALMQLSQLFPQTIFIGLDKLYREKRIIFPHKRGLQLSFGDWNHLNNLKAESIDSIFSVQSLSFWGIQGVGGYHFKDFNLSSWTNILNELERILKKGGVFRFDLPQNGEFLLNHMDPNIWQNESSSQVLIGRKK